MGLVIESVGSIVVIEKSSDLDAMGLNGLVGRTGVITESRADETVRRSNRGYWIKLTGAKFNGYQSWFIPYVSIKAVAGKTSAQLIIEDVISFEYDEDSGAAHVTTVKN